MLIQHENRIGIQNSTQIEWKLHIPCKTFRCNGTLFTRSSLLFERTRNAFLRRVNAYQLLLCACEFFICFELCRLWFTMRIIRHFNRFEVQTSIPSFRALHFVNFRMFFYHLNQHKTGKIRQNWLILPQKEDCLCDEQLGLNEYGNIVYINNVQSACSKWNGWMFIPIELNLTLSIGSLNFQALSS